VLVSTLSANPQMSINSNTEQHVEGTIGILRILSSFLII